MVLQGLNSTLLITNNPLAKEKYSGKHEIEFLEQDVQGVLIVVRDHIHRGHKLLTHPLSGSVKPNENPYKTVLLSKSSSKTDNDSVMIIEQSIITAKKFEKRVIQDRHLRDLQEVDLSLISNAFENTKGGS